MNMRYFISCNFYLEKKYSDFEEYVHILKAMTITAKVAIMNCVHENK